MWKYIYSYYNTYVISRISFQHFKFIKLLALFVFSFILQRTATFSCITATSNLPLMFFFIHFLRVICSTCILTPLNAYFEEEKKFTRQVLKPVWAVGTVTAAAGRPTYRWWPHDATSPTLFCQCWRQCSVAEAVFARHHKRCALSWALSLKKCLAFWHNYVLQGKLSSRSEWNVPVTEKQDTNLLWIRTMT